MVISFKESAGSYLAERRRTVRSPYCSPTELTAASGTAPGMVRNLNADGLYIEISGHYRIDEPVSLCFVFRSRMHSIRLMGRIRHVASNGVGIEFTADQSRRESGSERATRRFNPTSHEKNNGGGRSATVVSIDPKTAGKTKSTDPSAQQRFGLGGDLTILPLGLL